MSQLRLTAAIIIPPNIRRVSNRPCTKQKLLQNAFVKNLDFCTYLENF